MKKVLLFIFSVFCYGTAIAQNSSESAHWLKAIDCHAVLYPKADTYGYRMTTQCTKWLVWPFGIEAQWVSHGASIAYTGLGLGGKYAFGPFFISANAFPYAGVTMSSKLGNSTETQWDFTYGAMGSVGLGIKLFQSRKGSRYYLSGSYTVCAGEFHTDGIFDNGYWLAGLTFEY